MRRTRSALAIVALTGLALGVTQGDVSRVADAQVASATFTSLNCRVYVANENTNSISILAPAVDTSTNTYGSPIIATICLGSDTADDVAGTPGANFASFGAPCDGNADHHKPFYDGQVGTHGLWLTPDYSTLLATNRISSTVVAIDANAAAQCNATTARGCPLAITWGLPATDPKLAAGAYAPVGREPHLTSVRPVLNPAANQVWEAWVAVRGEHYVDVLNVDRTLLTSSDSKLEPPDRLPRSAPSVDTALGPSMVSFTTDGQYAFVAMGKQKVVQRFNATDRSPTATVDVAAPFTPFGLVAPPDLSGPPDDRGEDLYLVHKGVGQLSILKNLRTDNIGFAPLGGGRQWNGVPIGPCANHVAFAGKFAYVTIGGPPPCAPAVPNDPTGPANNSRQGGIVVVDRASRQLVAASQALLSLASAGAGSPSLLDAWASLGINTAPILSAAYNVNNVTNSAYSLVLADGTATWTGDPHGIWATPDGRYVFVGHESGNRVTTIFRADPTDPSKDIVAGTISAGSSLDASAQTCSVSGNVSPISCLRQPIDVVFQPLS